MGRNRELTTYVDDDLADRIERRAAEAEKTTSTWIADALEAYLQNERIDETARDVGAEQRVEELVAEARDEVAAAAEDLQEAATLASVYSIATWELVGADWGDVARRDSLSTGVRRTRERAPGLDTEALVDVDAEADAEIETGSTEDTGGFEL